MVSVGKTKSWVLFHKHRQLMGWIKLREQFWNWVQNELPQAV